MEKGLIQDFYSDSAWRFVQQNELSSRIDFEVSAATTRAYLAKDNVSQTLKRIADFFFERQTYDRQELAVSLRLLRRLLQELAGQQHVMEQQYREALDAIDH